MKQTYVNIAWKLCILDEPKKGKSKMRSFFLRGRRKIGQMKKMKGQVIFELNVKYKN